MRSGGIVDALPMPLGSLSTRGLAGPNGTPLMAEFPAPADPAGGVSCAWAPPGAPPSSSRRTSTDLRDIEYFRGFQLNHRVACPFPHSGRCRASARPGGPTGRCEAYNRFSAAWGAIAQYAKDHRELGDISSVSLSEFENRHREAERARDNVCAGRLLRRFPPDIIQR